jgi:hypothetical protein
MLELGFEVTAGWFCRRVKDVAVGVVFPTMVNAPKPAFLVAPEEQRRAAMQTVLSQ